MSTISRVIALLSALVFGIGAGSGIHVVSRNDQAGSTPVASQHNEERSSASPDAVSTETVAPEKIFDRLHNALGQSDRDRRKRQIASLADQLDSVQLREALQKAFRESHSESKGSDRPALLPLGRTGTARRNGVC
jgi:hypothetical protein